MTEVMIPVLLVAVAGASAIGYLYDKRRRRQEEYSRKMFAAFLGGPQTCQTLEEHGLSDDVLVSTTVRLWVARGWITQTDHPAKQWNEYKLEQSGEDALGLHYPELVRERSQQTCRAQ